MQDLFQKQNQLAIQPNNIETLSSTRNDQNAISTKYSKEKKPVDCIGNIFLPTFCLDINKVNVGTVLISYFLSGLS